MGFEYGYSVENIDALVMWEAQFGDFANGAQTVVDEFISSGEVKWGQKNALTLLLPHGHEGQGPDHTSGRPERYLQLAAEDNMRVAIPSTPANYFHLLRRQALTPKRKPLVVFTPKSLLRHQLCGVGGRRLHHRYVRAGPARRRDRRHSDRSRTTVKRVLLCSGKIYYDLLHRSGRAWPHGHRDRTGRAALPAAGGRAEGRAGDVPERDRRRVGAGGAGQPGRLELHRDEPDSSTSTASRCGASRDRRRRRRRSDRPSCTRSSRPR